jgi:hypothetical protein
MRMESEYLPARRWRNRQVIDTSRAGVDAPIEATAGSQNF